MSEVGLLCNASHKHSVNVLFLYLSFEIDAFQWMDIGRAGTSGTRAPSRVTAACVTDNARVSNPNMAATIALVTHRKRKLVVQNTAQVHVLVRFRMYKNLCRCYGLNIYVVNDIYASYTDEPRTYVLSSE